MEKSIMTTVQLMLSKLGLRVFRNNTGTGWVGEVVNKSQTQVVLKHPRPLDAGLVKGGSDLVGWQTVTVTPAMVGKPLAVFVAIEVKTPKGRMSPEQKNFLNNVRHAGGLGICVNSAEEVAEQVEIFNKILGVASS
jgi:hypothetical protein